MEKFSVFASGLLRIVGDVETLDIAEDLGKVVGLVEFPVHNYRVLQVDWLTVMSPKKAQRDELIQHDELPSQT